MCDCWTSYATGAAAYAFVSTGLFAACLRLILPERTFFILITLFGVARVGTKLAASAVSSYVRSALTKSVVPDPNDVPACAMRKPRVVEMPDFTEQENSHAPDPQPETVEESQPRID